VRVKKIIFFVYSKVKFFAINLKNETHVRVQKQ